jgi:hypothetical protein
MSDNEEKIKSLEAAVFRQDEAITELREQNHKFDLDLCKMSGTLSKVDNSQTELKETVNKYMDKDETTINGIFNLIRSMDAELKNSFKIRDEKIVQLQIDSAKVNTKQLIYGGVIFTVITATIQIVMRSMI